MRSENSKNQPKSMTSALKLIVAGLSIFALTACANGPDAPTRMIKQVTDGVEGISNRIKAVNVLLVTQADGSAVLVGTIVNTLPTTDSIQGITVNGVNAKLTAPIELALNSAARFAGDSANQSAVFPGLNLKPGTRADIEFTFATAAPIKLNALVRDRADIYANVSK